MPPETLILALLLIPLLIASGLCSGSETALFRLLRGDRSRLAVHHPHVAHAVEALLRDKGQVLVTILFLNMVVNVLYFVIASVLTMQQERASAGVAISIATLLGLILFGEVFAKLLAGSQRVRFVVLTAVPLLGVHRLLAPIRRVVVGAIVLPLVRLINPDASGEPRLSSPRELRTLVGLGMAEGVLDPDEQRMLREIVSLSSRRVREVMTPRRQMPWVDLSRPRDAALEVVARACRTELPASEGTLDGPPPRILMVRAALADSTWRPREHTREATFIPENIPLDRALHTLRERGEHLALCVDEHGAISGMLEIEALVEAIAIPVAHESDLLEEVRAGLWRASPRLSLHEFHQRLPPGGEPNEVSDASSLAALIAERLGRVPVQGDEITYRGYRIRVERVEHNAPQSLLIVDPREGGAG